MILSAISCQPQEDIAIKAPHCQVTYRELIEQVSLVTAWLQNKQVKSLALQCDNSPEWVYIDLACQQANVVFIPIPLFFNQPQREVILSSAKPSFLITVSSDDSSGHDFVFPSLKAIKLASNTVAQIPKGTSKITYTSGSTGTPKGVCLSVENQFNVAKSLVERIAIPQPNHFCLLPFSALLENIAGVYAPLMAGGTLNIFTDEERGFNGASITNNTHLLHTISSAKPETIILVPELLQFILYAIKSGWQAPNSFRFIAVGGSKVAIGLLEQANIAGLPVFQGYGLSECASVVSLCNPCESVASDAGRCLPHLNVELINDELVVSGNTFLGYLEQPQSWYQEKLFTGDLARIDNGHIEILGRCNNLIINSFGRNISPEWVESEILATGLFSQAIVFGDAKPFCVAILVPVTPSISQLTIDNALATLNQHLPEYANVLNYFILEQPLRYQNDFYTANGRPRRAKIYQHFNEHLDALYNQIIVKEHHHDFI